jgi:hypothetical protein
VWVNKYDRHKTSLTTTWGTFEYLIMSFGLINEVATFQRAMDYTFRDVMGIIIEIYQYDLTMFQNKEVLILDILRKCLKVFASMEYH